MSQNPLAISNSQPLQPPRPSNLKPQLTAALASLEVQLDQELARYRRSRPTATRTPLFGTNPTSFVVGNSNPPITPVDTIPATSEIEPNISAQPSANTASETEINRDIKLPPTEIPGVSSFTTPPPPPGLTTAANHIDTVEKDQHLEPDQTPSFSDDLSDNLDNEEEELPLTESQAQSPLVSIVPTPKANAGTPEHNSRNTNFGVPPTSEPDDYLESSEALLRSLNEEETQSESKRHNNSLLSPLGIGSMLLLLVASVILGIVLFQPKLIPQVNFGGLFPRNQSNNGETETATGENQSVPEPQLTPVPQYPNLAKDEFPEVQNPNDVVGLTPKASPTPISPANPATIPVAPAPNAAVSVNPAPPASVPQPPVQPPVPANTPATNQPTPVNEADLKPSASGLYQFVVENQSDAALANARKIVPDAYLSPDKKYIFVGAVSNKERAKQLITELQSKGLNVRPYQP